jgi:hypothetical protein
MVFLLELLVISELFLHFDNSGWKLGLHFDEFYMGFVLIVELL